MIEQAPRIHIVTSASSSPGPEGGKGFSRVGELVIVVHGYIGAEAMDIRGSGCTPDNDTYFLSTPVAT